MVSRRRRGPRSDCPSFKSADACKETTASCKWNTNVSKCRKAAVKRVSKRQAKITLACMSNKTKAACDKNKCLWGGPLGCTSKVF